ncbi:phosphotransferase enzyme family protein [Ktedonobacter robiniae]|nr:phosphotransferase [Ktedonobacter robiniae]
MHFTLPDAALVSALTAWSLPQLLTLTRIRGGFTGDVWYVDTSQGRLVAKFAYEAQEAFEAGLQAAEIVECAGIASGAPLRTVAGERTVMLEGPPTLFHPLALLHFVPGESLDVEQPASAYLAGSLLGRIHTILLREQFRPQSGDRLFAYLKEEAVEVNAQIGLPMLLQQAVEAVEAFEKRTQVTYGTLYGDSLQVLYDRETHRVGLIDWGTIGWGPLLFDVALATELFSFSQAQTDYFLQSYLAKAPIEPQELEGLKYYQALRYAQLAKFFAWRLAHQATLGNPDPLANELALRENRMALEHLLE